MIDPNSPLDSNIPLAKVIELRSQGMPNNQIIQLLQNEGFSSDQIFDAMNQADMSQNVGQGMPEPNVQPDMMENQMNMQPQGYDNYSPYGGGQPGRDMIEETTEAIINEKWKEVSGSISKFNEWKDKLEQRMTQMEARFKAIQDNFDKLHGALIAKIGEYDQNILNVGVEIKAMEKVFQKILPTFTENVNELSRLTEKMKK
jgi:DNA-binding transcriptional MerR regulator